jgi:hypothetical protein
MIDTENLNKAKNTMEEKIIKIREIRKYDNEKYGIKDYYGIKHYEHLSNKELDKRLTEITIERARA